MENNKINKAIIDEDSTLKDAIRCIDNTGLGICIITDKERKIKGILSDGDIRKALLDGQSINEKTSEIMNKTPLTLKEGHSVDEIKEEAKKRERAGRMCIPIVNEDKEIVDLAIVPEPKVTFLSKQESTEKPIRKVLVTGGAGFLGSVLVKKLLDRGYKVRVIDKLVYDAKSLEDQKNNPDLELIEGDLRHTEDIKIDGVDAFIHLAGIVGDPACSISAQDTIKQNFLLTTNLAQLCKYYQINRFVFASSCSVYGA